MRGRFGALDRTVRAHEGGRPNRQGEWSTTATTNSAAARCRSHRTMKPATGRNRLQVARTHLRPVFGARVSFVHTALFAHLWVALRPGGRLHAQCGGGPNLREAHTLAERVMARAPFAEYFAGWPGPWTFASAGETAARLTAAGVVDVATESRGRTHHAGHRSGRPRVCHDGDLPSPSRPPARRLAGAVHRRGHEAGRGSAIALHPGRLATPHDGRPALALTGPAVCCTTATAPRGNCRHTD